MTWSSELTFPAINSCFCTFHRLGPLACSDSGITSEIVNPFIQSAAQKWGDC